MLSVTATSARLPSCPRCAGAVSVTWRRLREELEGHGYRDFLGRHLRQYAPSEIRGALEAARRELAPLGDARQHLRAEWVRAAREGDLLERSGPEAMDRCLERLREAAAGRPVRVTETLALDAFEMMSLAVVARALTEGDLADALETGSGPLGRYLWRLWVGAAGAGLAYTGGLTPAGGLGWVLLGLVLLGPLARWIDRLR